MNKFFLVLLVIVSSVCIVYASGEQEAGDAVSETSKIVFWSYMGGAEGEALTDMVAEYNSMQNKYEVEIEYVPPSELRKKYTIAHLADSLPDLGTVDNPDHSAFAAMGLFEDITELVAEWEEGNEAYFPGPWKSTIYEGRNYGIPFTSNCLALWYDKELLTQEGLDVPETWEELKAVGKKLTTEDRYGLAISAVKTEEGTFQLLPWLLSTGADVTNPASAEAIKALQFLRELVDEGIMSPEVINWGQADIQKQFSSGRAAMMINGPWMISTVKEESPNLDFGIAMVPKDKKFSSVLGGENIGIMRNGNVDGAWDFLKWFLSKENVDKYINQTGYFPPRADVASGNERWTTDPLLSVFMEEMQYAMPRGPHPKWPQISSALSEALQKVLVGVESPDQAMRNAQKIIDEALK